MKPKIYKEGRENRKTSFSQSKIYTVGKITWGFLFRPLVVAVKQVSKVHFVLQSADHTRSSLSAMTSHLLVQTQSHAEQPKEKCPHVQTFVNVDVGPTPGLVQPA